MFAAITTFALTPEMIGISNLTGGERVAGTFEINGVVLNDGQVNNVAVKVGTGQWANATGIDRWSYKVNTRANGPIYGDLPISIGAFSADNTKLAEKTINVTVLPEKPYTDIISGTYTEPFNLILKAAADTTIYYTTDGTNPQVNGVAYTGAIYINRSLKLTAVAKSTTDIYSEPSVIDLKIKDGNVNQPWIFIQYYTDQALTCPVPFPAYLKAGTYYLKMVTDRKITYGPFLSIDVPDYTNDVSHRLVDRVSDCVYRYTRVVKNDSYATGTNQEVISIDGEAANGYYISIYLPTGVTERASYLDTYLPDKGSIAVKGGGTSTGDPTPCFTISSSGAAEMRLALSESGLTSAPWIKYATSYQAFDISAGGNGTKTIWIEFRDRAGNIQSSHASTSVYYENTSLSFDIEYFTDDGLIHSLGPDPYLKSGTYYLKITANQNLTENPIVQIDAEGSNNDVADGLTTMINQRIYYFTRSIVPDAEALGATREQVTINTLNPSNTAAYAAFVDTQTPEAPVVSGQLLTSNPRPTWSWASVTGATRYRYSLTDGADWIEITGRTFTPGTNLPGGCTYTLYVQAGDQAGNWSGSGSFTTAILSINVVTESEQKEVPNGSGQYNFDNTAVCSRLYMYFEVQNNSALDLAPIQVEFSGENAEDFEVGYISSNAPVQPGDKITLGINFVPKSTGTKTATVKIINNTPDANPYTFTVTGTGAINGTLTLDTWTIGNFYSPYSWGTKTYTFNATPGKVYALTWDDSSEGTGKYFDDIAVDAYHQDGKTPYFNYINLGYTEPQLILAADNLIYIKVDPYSSSSPGGFALKISEVPPEPVIRVKTGNTKIVNGTGSYDYGNVPLSTGVSTSFHIENKGGADLNLTGDPAKIQISGPDASCFTVTVQAVTPVGINGSASFSIVFIPNNSGTKNATVSIANNDTDNNPFTFSLTGTGTGTIEPLPLETWQTGQLTKSGELKLYSSEVTPGKTYAVTWDDSSSGSGTLNGNVSVSAYHPDWASTYFISVDSGYTSPMVFIAQENTVSIKVQGYSSSTTGSFAVKVYEVLPKAVMNVRQGRADIPNGTGTYDFGNVSLCTYADGKILIENKGSVNINLTGNPQVQISGADAANFRITGTPSSIVDAYGKSTNLWIRFQPSSLGTKTATVSISNNTADANPYTFTLTGTATGTFHSLTLGTWATDTVSNPNEIKLYSVAVIPGNTYLISWDDKYDGTSTYTADIYMMAYKQNFTDYYFYETTSGYANPQNITPQEEVIYLKVRASSSSSSTGTYAIKIDEITPHPAFILTQNNTNVPNEGNCTFANTAVCSSKSMYFEIRNTGTGNLNLTGTPTVQLSGANASEFNVSTSSLTTPIASKNYSYFYIYFSPKSAGQKTATVTIPNNTDAAHPFTFTVTGTAVIEGTLSLDTWTPGNIAVTDEDKTYCVNLIPGNSYAIYWDDSSQGSQAYTGNVRVTAYQANGSSGYFYYIDSAYLTPQTFIAKDSTAYIVVEGYNYNSTGTFALKASVYEPVMTLQTQQNNIAIPKDGNYNFGSVTLGSSTDNKYFNIKNTGGNMFFTGNPVIRISGADAANFSVTYLPSSPLCPGCTTSFSMKFAPTSGGTKTATVSIDYNSTVSPFTFTVTGTSLWEGLLPVGIWTTGNVSYNGQVKMYGTNAIVGNNYAISWDSYNQGSGTYQGYIRVSAYRANAVTPYFERVYDGYRVPQVITALDDMIYLKVECVSSSNTGSFALKPSISGPVLDVKQGTTLIPAGSGSCTFGNVPLKTSNYLTFTISNTGGTSDLILTDTPKIRITGADASAFSVSADPTSPVTANNTTTFTIKFNPTSTGTKTATVSIASNAPNTNPFTFTITGTAETLALDTWIRGAISYGDVKTYALPTTAGSKYAIAWDDSNQGSGTYTCNVKVSAYRADLNTYYFVPMDSGYTSPYTFTAEDDIAYIKVAGYSSSSVGSFGIKAFVCKPVMNIKQGTTTIPNGTGSYNFGDINLGLNNSISFAIENLGYATYLNLTSTPKININGPDAAAFSITTQPSASIYGNYNTTFTLCFAPTTPGPKTATVSIANNDTSNNPYTFTLTGNGTVTIGELAPDTWTTGQFAFSNEIKYYSIKTIAGEKYSLMWDDYNGSGTYTGDIKITAYRPGYTTTYFTNADLGFTTPQIVTAQDDIIYIKVTGYTNSTPGYALKVSSAKSVAEIQQGATLLSNGGGSYDFGNVILCTGKSVVFTIFNRGSDTLTSSAYYPIAISGADASSFKVTSQPTFPVAPNSSTSFTINFIPNGAGIKKATINLTSNDPANNPYTFAVTGTGTGEFQPLTAGAWTPDRISTAGEVKLYSLGTIPQTGYAITWDDSVQGSGNYTGNVKISVYKQDCATTYSYATDIDSGYLSPTFVTATENVVYIKVTGYNTSSTGTFALKAALIKPIINIKTGTKDIPSKSGSYDFGSIQFLASTSASFTVENTGTTSLNLTGYSYVQTSGTDASSFSVTTQPSGSIGPNRNSGFTMAFTPTSPGVKTATVYIYSNDSDNSPYTFTVTGTALVETLTLNNWKSGQLARPEDIKTFAFAATPGTSYALAWDEYVLGGSSSYSAGISVSAYDNVTISRAYFTNVDSGFSTPQPITALNDLIYIKVKGGSGSGMYPGSFALKMTLVQPVIDIRGGQNSTPIANGTGSYDFGKVAMGSSNIVSFTIYNPGGSNLSLTSTPKVQISGPDAVCFSLTTDATSPVTPNGNSVFKINFKPTTTGAKTAVVKVANSADVNNPYTFTITGTSEVMELDTWTEGNISTSGEVKTYCFIAIPGRSYYITWDDNAYIQSGEYTCRIKISAYGSNLTTAYFTNESTSYYNTKEIRAYDNMVYIKVTNYDSYSAATGTFALKAKMLLPKMVVKQEGNSLLNGSGVYDFGSTANTAVFDIYDVGNGPLYLTGTPQISGTDASSFLLTFAPSSPIVAGSYNNFSIKFSPTSEGPKTATVTIANDDPVNNPYTFTLTGTGVVETLIPETWTSGDLKIAGEEKTYSFNATPGKYYTIAWDDSLQGTGNYTGNIKMSAYRQDAATAYFSGIDSGFTTPQIIAALDSIIYLRVAGQTYSAIGSFALKAAPGKPKLTVKQGTTIIVPDTGSFDFGTAASVTFTIQNTGDSPLNLTDSTRVRINGTDAACFGVTTMPASPVAPNATTTFVVKFTPNGFQTKTAVVSIVSDDGNSPFNFSITATRVVDILTPGVWTSGSIVAGSDKAYSFKTIPGKNYAVFWDDIYSGSGSYNCDVKVSAYRPDSVNTYFSNMDSAYSTPQTITALDDIVYIKVTGFSSSSAGTFAVKATASEPLMGVKQGTTVIPNNSGNYNFGNVGQATSSSVTFTITNAGGGPLNLTDTTRVQISGTDAACFSVTTQPSSPIAVNGTTTFIVKFAPGSTGVKTATVSIANNDTNNSPYTFTLTGTGTTIAAELLALGTWIPKSIGTAGEVKTYYFNATPGKTYTIAWDDSYQGSKTYTCDIYAAAYRQDLTTAYFGNTDSGYTSPKSIVAQESIVYIRVCGYYSSSTGSFALKIVQVN